MDPITLLFGAVALVKQIKAGCDQLHEGRMAIEEFKKGAERAVGDVKAIAKELTGFWGWVKGLLGIKSESAPVVQLAEGVKNALLPTPLAAVPLVFGAVAVVKAMPPATYEPDAPTSPVTV